MTDNINSSLPSRQLSIPELFRVLQEEYIVCELRFKIYPVARHKEYWGGLMEKKKQKILLLSRNNKFPSIFDSEGIKRDFSSKIIPEIGFPNFIYRDDHQRFSQEKWDIHNYYLVGERVRVYCETRGKLEGKIKKPDFPNKRIDLLIKNEVLQFDIATVTRIL